jgi:hypothetical protein
VFTEGSRSDAVEGVADLQQREAEPDATTQTSHAPVSDEVGAARAPAGKKGKCGATTRSGRRCTSAATPTGYCIMHSPDAATQALMAQARRLGGSAPRARLGLNTDAVALGTAEDQLALLVATVKALATNSISSSTAAAITNAVKTASQIVGQDQAARIQELERRLDDIVVPHRR